MSDTVAVPGPVASEPPRSAPLYQMFMLALSVLALVAIGIQNVFKLHPEIEQILLWADNAICVAFLIDFVVTLWRAPDKMRYMVTWGWIDLISSIPTFDIGRWGRLARIARIARVLRALRATTLLTRVVVQKKAQSTSIGAGMLAFLLIIGCSTAILQFENLPQANIKSAEDAVWWAFTTITTVGYGDRFPVTMEGRIVAAVLMTAGVGLFGAISATLAATFLMQNEQDKDTEISRLRDEIAALREVVEKLVPPPKP